MEHSVPVVWAPHTHTHVEDEISRRKTLNKQKFGKINKQDLRRSKLDCHISDVACKLLYTVTAGVLTYNYIRLIHQASTV